MKIVKIYNELINENQGAVIAKIVELLNSSYEPKIGIKRDFDEYFTKPAILNKVDEELISPVMLLDYLKSKFRNVSGEFIEQVIRDWFNGKYKSGEYQLSKNIPM